MAAPLPDGRSDRLFAATPDLAPDQGLASGRHVPLMANFVFTCPATGFNVQHQLDDDPDVSENIWCDSTKSRDVDQRRVHAIAVIISVWSILAVLAQAPLGRPGRRRSFDRKPLFSDRHRGVRSIPALGGWKLAACSAAG